MQSSNNFRVPINFFPVQFNNEENFVLGGKSAFEYCMPGAIGGPMAISNEYRLNVPVVTYGFDPSFLSFFGTNGVTAVEGAIQILNDLPAASSISLTNFAENSVLTNLEAQSQSLYDLRSVTLSLLLEQMGLASPTRSIYVMKSFSPLVILMRNYDSTLAPSPSVNSYEYDWLGFTGMSNNENVFLAQMVLADVAQQEPSYPAVADNQVDIGQFYTGLTEDDAAGLSYLYSTNNVNYEALLSGVSGAGTNANSWINGAWRPGIEKISFVPQTFNAALRQFLTMTNQYTDTYITNGSVTRQQVQRVISKPDFLFCVGDTDADYPEVLPYARTGTSNWINNATPNGNSSGAGPGVIQPTVRITFAKLGTTIFGDYGPPYEGTSDVSFFWGTYDQSTNPPIVYPQPSSATNQLLFRLWFTGGGPWFPIPPGQEIELSATGFTGTDIILQRSTNLTDWSSILTNGVNGSICTLFGHPSLSEDFYRIVSK